MLTYEYIENVMRKFVMLTKKKKKKREHYSLNENLLHYEVGMVQVRLYNKLCNNISVGS
jgi:hypothetical protein